MKELVFLLEEESAKAMLEGLLPRLVGGRTHVQPRYIVFEGKQDLESNLTKRLRHYLNPKAKFIVLRDQDRDDCRKVKHSLMALCRKANRPAVIRIACHELEAYYLGDLLAVEPLASQV
jgi:hypothetical protein